MNKKLASLTLAVVFSLATVGAAFADIDCKVDAVDATGKVTLSCDKDKAAKLKAGDAVQVKPKKKLEGC